MKRTRLDNKGFSLVELLIGITMLAIIVVPILHAFLTSSKTSVKAREVRNQTVAAQNILESYQTTDVGSLIGNIRQFGELKLFENIALSSALYAYNDDLDEYEEVTYWSKDSGRGDVYRLLLTGVGDKKYDAVLNLDATKYGTRNSAGIVDYKPMDAVYTQPPPGDDENPDTAAAREFASLAQIDTGCLYIDAYGIASNFGGVPIDQNYFTGKLNRTVTVTIKKIGGTSGVISCTALFEYTTTFRYALMDFSTFPPTVRHCEKNYTHAVTNDFYSGSYTPDESTVYGLYFFFYPLDFGNDLIKVMNRDNITMSVYLVKQNTASGRDPDIELHEKKDPLTTPPRASLYYNNALQAYKIWLGLPLADGSFFDAYHKKKDFDGNLVGTPAKNRLYNVTVALYKPGSIDDLDGSVSGAPLATFDASSLE